MLSRFGAGRYGQRLFHQTPPIHQKGEGTKAPSPIFQAQTFKLIGPNLESDVGSLYSFNLLLLKYQHNLGDSRCP